MITTFDQKLAELLNNWNIDGWPIGNLVLVVIALVLSVILCGVIGLEREITGRSAGLRTHLLVGLGSCILMIVSIYGFPAIFGEKRDVARLAAQVVTGVGFLGAGAIMYRNNGIKGLTTAGTIWIVMAIGMACGSFNFIIAAVGTILIYVILTVFKKIEARINRKHPTIILRAPEEVEGLLGIILNTATEFEATVNIFNTELHAEENGKRFIEIVFQVMFQSKSTDASLFLATLEERAKASSIQLVSRR